MCAGEGYICVGVGKYNFYSYLEALFETILPLHLCTKCNEESRSN
jgi:hypothetical protein